MTSQEDRHYKVRKFWKVFPCFRTDHLKIEVWNETNEIFSQSAVFSVQFISLSFSRPDTCRTLFILLKNVFIPALQSLFLETTERISKEFSFKFVTRVRRTLSEHSLNQPLPDSSDSLVWMFKTALLVILTPTAKRQQQQHGKHQTCAAGPTSSSKLPLSWRDLGAHCL